ncbi:MAG TPA: choice-of-anchor Q domain-containing protein, partial [Gemmataceae bacterium]|nr:choice-of-anchor Q domain-containing protein [Gemmataceae bacterium]
STAITFNSAVAGAGGMGGKGGDVGNSFYNGPGGDGGTGGHVKGGGLFTLGNALEFTSSPFTHNTANAGAGGAGGNGGNGGGHGGAAYDTFNSGGKGGIGGDAQGGGIWTSHTYLEADAAIDFNSAVAGKGGNGGNGGPGDYVGGFASDGGVGGIAQGGGLYAEFGSCNFYDSSVSSNTATGGDGGDGGDAGPTGDFNYPSMASANGALAGTAEGGGVFALQEAVYMIREQVNSNIAAGGKGGTGGDGPAGPTGVVSIFQFGGSGGDGGSGGHGGLGQGGGVWAVGPVSVSLSTFDSNNAFGGFGGHGGHGGASGPGTDGALPAGNGGSAGHGGGAQGGGLYLSGANFETSSCTFSHNGLAPGRGGFGGAGGNSQAAPGSSFGAGGAGAAGGNGGVGQGAGMFDDDTDTLMDNVTISSNFVLDSFGGNGGAGGAGVDPGQNGPGGGTGLHGDVWGGGILLTKGHLGLGNVTIAFNTLFGPTGQGGGVFCLTAKDIQFGTVDAFDTLIAKNTSVVAPDYLGHFSPISTKILLGVNDGSNLPFDGVLVGSQTKGPVEPRLGPLQYNGGPNQLKTHALLTATGFSPASPAINSGDSNFASGENDERGLPRIVGKSVDIGAFELQASFIVQPENHNHGQPGGTHPAKVIDRVFSLLIPGSQFLTTELAAHPMEFGLPGFLIRPADRMSTDLANSGIWRGFLGSANEKNPPPQTQRQQESRRRDEAIWFEAGDFGMASLPWLFNTWAG